MNDRTRRPPMELVRGREAVSRLLDALDGTWQGTGHGEYPTLESFDYREVLRITRHATDPMLHFEQRTWRDEDGAEVPSHWESGFVRFLGGGRVELVNAQSGGRAEVLTGDAIAIDDSRGDGHGAWELRLEAIEHVHDDRMRGATRRWHFDGAALSYEMHMATATNPRLDLHLRAALSRPTD